jgi:hypothetical protein
LNLIVPRFRKGPPVTQIDTARDVQQIYICGRKSVFGMTLAWWNFRTLVESGADLDVDFQNEPNAIART